jgi:hypothetical protein
MECARKVVVCWDQDWLECPLEVLETGLQDEPDFYYLTD